jgi:hypothetical protein
VNAFRSGDQHVVAGAVIQLVTATAEVQGPIGASAPFFRADAFPRIRCAGKAFAGP